jgi:hypothetical protein
MSSTVRQYLFGLIFIGVGIYQLYIQDVIEAVLYIMAGLAFMFNSLVSEPKLQAYRKILVTITWTLIIATGILFLYLIRTKWF